MENPSAQVFQYHINTHLKVSKIQDLSLGICYQFIVGCTYGGFSIQIFNRIIEMCQTYLIALAIDMTCRLAWFISIFRRAK